MRGSGGGAQHRLHVLVVEDAPEVADLARRALEAAGFAVDVVGDLAGARSRLLSDKPDVVVLDVELPDGSGIDFLRERVSPVPVLLLSARASELDRVLGLELGAEDYVVKPFMPRELATRVRMAASRRQTTAPPERVEFGDLVIDLPAREVTKWGERVNLTPREFDLLAHMARSPRQVFSREELLRDVWQSNPDWQSAKTVNEHVRRLRLKIEDDPARPRWILTAGRAGYRFEPPSPSSS